MGRTEKADSIFYRRSRFSARLPKTHRYSPAHQWSAEVEPGLYRLGLTRFATRMLGDLVEFEFSIQEGESLEPGQSLGWIEGFKARSDIYAVRHGRFAGWSPALGEDITLMDRDPHHAGWLYQVRGEPDSNTIDVHAYIALLDATIDKMLAQRGEGLDHG